MISNPIDAIGNCRTRSQLARTLEELMKPQYPNGDRKGWEVWSVKYKSVATAKKCAVAMYQKMIGER
jgi:hypothetical protein